MQDFLAAARHLFQQQYTSPQHLAIWGRSAGGLTVAAALNMDPAFARVAVLDVPFLDVLNTMRDPELPLTIKERREWGDPLNTKVRSGDVQLAHAWWLLQLMPTMIVALQRGRAASCMIEHFCQRMLVQTRHVSMLHQLSSKALLSGVICCHACTGCSPKDNRITGTHQMIKVATKQAIQLPAAAAAMQDAFAYISSYSPYSNINRSVEYPAMLLTASLHDTRVNYWEPAKYVAAMRFYAQQRRQSGQKQLGQQLKAGVAAPVAVNSTAAQQDGGVCTESPVLLMTDMDAGHFAASAASTRLRERASKTAFILHNLGG